MWTDGWTDSQHEPNTHFLEMCELPGVGSLCHTKKLFTRHALTCVGIERAVCENDVTIVVNCYGVVPPVPDCCKSDTSECYYVENFVRI
jgi:hypothetical protein